MSGFNASSVAALDYDFSSITGPDGMPLSAGVIPEPSADTLMAFLEAGQRISEQEDADPKAQFDEMRQALANLCGGTPSLAEIEALPVRVLKEFSSWLQSEFAGPKA